MLVKHVYVIKRTLNAWIEHYTFNVWFTMCYMYICTRLKNVCLPHSMRNMHISTGINYPIIINMHIHFWL